MRVIAGRFKGRRLVTVRSGSVRYTSDRVRESLFAIIRDIVPGSFFLDLFVEKNPRCVKAIRENLRLCGLPFGDESVHIFQKDALRAFKAMENMGLKFDLVFLDPPYGSFLLEKALRKLDGSQILSDDAMVIAERPFRSFLPEETENLTRIREERYGDTVLTFYKRRKP